MLFVGIVCKQMVRNTVLDNVFGLKLNFENYENQNIEANRNIFVQGANNIYSSRFILCTTSQDGGAIFSVDNLTIFNCFFLSNSANQGSCIYCHSNLQIERATFINCQAKDCATIYSSNYYTSVFNCSLTAFQSSSATDYTCIFRDNSGLFYLSGDNFTSSFARNSVGCFGVHNSIVNTKYLVLLSSRSKHHLNIYLNNCNAPTLTYTIFMIMLPFETNEPTSLALFYGNSNGDCTLNFVSFIPGPNFNHTPFESNNGATIILSNLLTRIPYESIYREYIVFGNNCKFDCDYNEVFRYRTKYFIGYVKDLKFGENMSIFSLPIDVVLILTVFTISSCIGALFSLVVTNRFVFVLQAVKNEFLGIKPRKKIVRKPTNMRKINQNV